MSISFHCLWADETTFTSNGVSSSQNCYVYNSIRIMFRCLKRSSFCSLEKLFWIPFFDILIFENKEIHATGKICLLNECIYTNIYFSSIRIRQVKFCPTRIISSCPLQQFVWNRQIWMSWLFELHKYELRWHMFLYLIIRDKNI